MSSFTRLMILAALMLCAVAARAADALPASITFDLGKVDISADSKAKIDVVAAAVKAKPDAALTVSGFTDTSGDPAKNAELAKQRAFAVRDALKLAGVAEDKITLQKPGEVMSAGTPEEARRVEIKLAQAAAPAAPAATPAPADAAAAPAAAPAPVPNKGDTAWMIVATCLVLLMTLPGLALFYGGMVRAKNVLSILMQCFVTFSLLAVLWAIYGYSIAFTEGGSYFGGFDRLFLKGMTPDSAAATFSKGVVIPEYIYMAFQLTFATITPCLILGAFAERIKFSSVLVFMVIWFTFAYLPIAHMVWFWPGPDAFTDAKAAEAATAKAGLIWQWGALDFAGGTVVHINAGVAGLVGAYLVGKRIGYGREAMPPHNLALTMIGASLLWFGWFGFNAGSNLEANGAGALAFVNTLLATAMATITWSFAEWIGKGKPSMLGAASGAVAGLVAITPACGFVGPMGALAIGFAGGLLCLWGVTGLKRLLGADDALDVFGVHAIGGITGALLTGVFAAPSLGGVGIIDWVTMKVAADYSIGGQVWIQLKAVLMTIVWSGIVAAVAYKLVDIVMGLRVAEEEEREGLDISSHGEAAYRA